MTPQNIAPSVSLNPKNVNCKPFRLAEDEGGISDTAKGCKISHASQTVEQGLVKKLAAVSAPCCLAASHKPFELGLPPMTRSVLDAGARVH